jgi:hypothetical protein
MAENTQVGSALGYDELLGQLQSSITDRVIGKSNLDKASDVLNKITTTHLMLSQFGFYNKIIEGLKGLGGEAVKNLKSKAEAISNIKGGDSGVELNGMEGLKDTIEMTPLEKTAGREFSGYDPAEGVFGRVIGRDAPFSQVDSEVANSARTVPRQAGQTETPTSNEPSVPSPEQTELQRLQALREDSSSQFDDFMTDIATQKNKIESDYGDFQKEIFERSGNLITPDDVPQFAEERDRLWNKEGRGIDEFEARDAELADKISSMKRIMSVQPLPEDAPRTAPRPAQKAQLGEPEEPAPQQAPRQAVPELTEPIVPTTVEAGELPQTLGQFVDRTAGTAREASQALGQVIAKGDARLSFQQSIGSYMSKAQDLRTSLESGVERINSLRNQATTAFNNIKSEGQAFQEKGQSLLSQGRDALAKGDQTGQSLIDQGNDLLNKGIEQAKNSDLANQAVSQAQQKIQQGSDLLAQGKQEGQAFIDQGRDLLKSAQSQVEGYGQQAEQIGQVLQSEVEQRTTQLAEFAGQAKEAFTTGKAVAGALASGDTQAFVEGGQALGKTVGSVAGKVLGEETGDAIGAGISSAIPVVGEIVDAGLLLSTLFTSIADAFQPHHLPTYIDTATQQYGV